MNPDGISIGFLEAGRPAFPADFDPGHEMLIHYKRHKSTRRFRTVFVDLPTEL